MKPVSIREPIFAWNPHRVGTGSKKKETIWPDARYVPDGWLKNPGQYGGFIPSVNEHYVTWSTRFPFVLCYDLHERKLLRVPSKASTILAIQAFPHDLVWFGDYGDGANRGHFVEIRKMD
jgi:hypothetical protein